VAPGVKPAGKHVDGRLDFLERVSLAGLRKKHSASAEESQAAELARIRQLSASERMALALALGRRSRDLVTQRLHETSDE